MKSKRLNPFQVLRDQLAIMSFYERFEQVVALVLSAVIAVIIVVSLFQLISIVFTLLVLDAFNPLDHKVFQSVFGMIMTLLIAMEFKHSIVRVALPYGLAAWFFQDIADNFQAENYRGKYLLALKDARKHRFEAIADVYGESDA